MHTYTPKTFSIPNIEGLSPQQIDEHLKLYSGYVAHVNKISEEVKKLSTEKDLNSGYAMHEFWRRLGFEFNGMRSHEYYFGALENGAQPFDTDSAVGKAIVAHYGGYAEFERVVKSVAGTRGSGWVMLYYDPVDGDKPFIVGWVDEHHIGYLSSLPIILAIDCWEHAYMVDYPPGGRAEYVDIYLKNINWETVDNWFQQIPKTR